MHTNIKQSPCSQRFRCLRFHYRGSEVGLCPPGVRSLPLLIPSFLAAALCYEYASYSRLYYICFLRHSLAIVLNKTNGAWSTESLVPSF